MWKVFALPAVRLVHRVLWNLHTWFWLRVENLRLILWFAFLWAAIPARKRLISLFQFCRKSSAAHNLADWVRTDCECLVHSVKNFAFSILSVFIPCSCHGC